MSTRVRSTDRTTRKPQPRLPPAVPPPDLLDRIARFSLEEYHGLFRAGVLTPESRVELLHGYIVQRPPVNPPHKTALRRLVQHLTPLLSGWVLDSQTPVTIDEDEPQPDFSVTVPPESRYAERHAGPGEIAFVAEVSDTTLAVDRGDKLVMYARAKVPVYWVVNIPERRVEVYTQPRGGKRPTYRSHIDYTDGQVVPVVIAGEEVGRIAVSEILP